ncbi:RNA polymerase sigma-70 factor [Sphingobacterium siyangense]|uniref:RNA polymerase sigma factor n=1 Tax=Sphingobacterium siyangense TaxID=459529 RepID=UPI002FDEC152
MRKSNDQNIIHELAMGNEWALSELYDEHWHNLFNYISKILDDTDDVSDVVQETFITLWNLRTKLELVRSIKSYLFIIARNKAFKKLQEKLRQDEVFDKYFMFLNKEDYSLSDYIETKELANIIDGEIDKLPARMREIFILSRKENLSYAEIASKLEISSETVKKQIHRSLKYLRSHIDNNYYNSLVLMIFLEFLHDINR